MAERAHERTITRTGRHTRRSGGAVDVATGANLHRGLLVRRHVTGTTLPRAYSSRSRGLVRHGGRAMPRDVGGRLPGWCGRDGGRSRQRSDGAIHHRTGAAAFARRRRSRLPATARYYIIVDSARSLSPVDLMPGSLTPDTCPCSSRTHISHRSCSHPAPVLGSSKDIAILTTRARLRSVRRSAAPWIPSDAGTS